MAKRKTRKKGAEPKNINIQPYLTPAVEQYLMKAVKEVKRGKFGELEDVDLVKMQAEARKPYGRKPQQIVAEGVEGFEIEAMVDAEGSFSPKIFGAKKQLWFFPYTYGNKGRLVIRPRIRNALNAINSTSLAEINTFIRSTQNALLKEKSDRLTVNMKDRGIGKKAQIVFVPYDKDGYEKILKKINRMVVMWSRIKDYKEFYLVDQGEAALIDLYNNTLDQKVSVVSLPLTLDPKEEAARKKAAQDETERLVQRRIAAIEAEASKRSPNFALVSQAFEKADQEIGDNPRWQKFRKEILRKIPSLDPGSKSNPKRKRVRLVRRKIRRRR